MTKAWGLGAVMLWALTGCSKETTTSDLHKTKAFTETVVVTAGSESSSRVHVTLQVAGDESNVYIDLAEGDALVASAEGQSQEMRHLEAGEYEAEFGAGAEGTEFVVSLERAEDDPAPNTRGTLPAPFSLDDLESGLSRAADELIVSWDPSGGSDKMELEIDGSCIFSYKEDVTDDGSHTIGAGELDSTGGENPETCELTAKLTRSRGGSADPALDPESTVRLVQVRSRTFNSAP